MDLQLEILQNTNIFLWHFSAPRPPYGTPLSGLIVTYTALNSGISIAGNTIGNGNIIPNRNVLTITNSLW